MEESRYEPNIDNVNITEYRAKDEDGLGHVVKFVQWHYVWTHPDYPGAETTSLFMTELPEANSENFIDFNDVTEEVLKQWVISIETEKGTLDNIYPHAMEQLPLNYRISQTIAYTMI